MSPLVSVPDNEVDNPRPQPFENRQIEDPQAQPLLNTTTTTELGDDEFWPLSGKPYFNVVLTKSHVKPVYHMVFPSKMHPVLPCCTIDAVVTYRRKNWETVYYGESSYKRFDISWKEFVIDNDLKLGDALVFELLEHTSSKLKFRVQILRGDIPHELLQRISGMHVYGINASQTTEDLKCLNLSSYITLIIR